LRLPFSSDKHKRASSTDSPSIRPRIPSGQGGTKFNTRKALRNTSKILDVLKIVSDASSLLVPLNTTWDALKIVATTAEVGTERSYLVDVLIGLYHQDMDMFKNKEDLKDLFDNLHQQLNWLSSKTRPPQAIKRIVPANDEGIGLQMFGAFNDLRKPECSPMCLRASAISIVNPHVSLDVERKEALVRTNILPDMFYYVYMTL